MSPLNFLSTRSFITWPRISSSAIGYKGIVYLEYAGATLATQEAGKTHDLSASSAISRQDQARSSVRMHSVMAIVMPKPYCYPSYKVQFIRHIYTSWSAQHYASFIYSARCSTIWQRRVEAISPDLCLIYAICSKCLSV